MIVTGHPSVHQHTRLTSILTGSRSDRGWLEVFPGEHDPTRASIRGDHDRGRVGESIQRLIPQHKPRPAQIEALYHLLFGTTDVVLQAGTGYGKSVVFQLLPTLAKELCGIDSSTLMISPLNSLTEQQVSNLDRITPSLTPPARINGVAVTGSKNSSNEAYDKIGMGEYTHVSTTIQHTGARGVVVALLIRSDKSLKPMLSALTLRKSLTRMKLLMIEAEEMTDEDVTVCISPEQVCDHRFRERVIRKPEFRKDCVFLVVDEAHCIVQWSTFRKEYGKFGGLRLSLPGSTRVFGTSATLRPPLRDVMLKTGPFRRADVKFINTTVDRPEIFLDIRFMEASKKNMEDLHWLIPQRTSVEEVPQLRKTIVFFDNRRTARQACEHLRLWLVLAGARPDVAERAILPYYAILSQDTKDARLQDFMPKDSPIRILLATDAVGMGIDIEGVELVVQYGGERILRDIGQLTTLMQRMGRGARVEGEKAAFVWIVESWAKPTLLDLKLLPPLKDKDLSGDVNMVPIPVRRKPKKQKASKYQGTQGSTQWAYSQSQNPIGESGLSAVTTMEASSGAHRDRREALHPIYQLMLWDCPRRAIMRATYAPGSRIWQLPEYKNPRCCSFEHPSQRPVSLSARSPAEQVNLIKKMKTLKSERIKGVKRDELLRLAPSFPLTGEWKYFSTISDRLKEWRVNKCKEMPTRTMYMPPTLLLTDECVTRIAVMNSWLVGENALAMLEHFVPEFEYPERWGQEIIQIVKNAVQVPPANPIRIQQYQKQQKQTEEKRVREALEVRDQMIQARYGNNPPKSEIPGDVYDRANPQYQVLEPVGISTVGDVVGRVDNQDPSWKNAERIGIYPLVDSNPASSATSVAGDEDSIGEGIHEGSGLEESEFPVDESVGQSFCSTASTIVPTDTVEPYSTSRTQKDPRNRGSHRVDRLQRQNSREARLSTPPPPPPPPTITRSGRRSRMTAKALETWQASSDEGRE